MKDKEFKNMTLNELLESNLSLEDIDDIIDDLIEWDYQVEKKTESEEINENRVHNKT